ncbi:hypothetical protein FDT66_08195 [Polaribacter aestuariivivens]|uniref:Uncharacterized protein n=1 Tax=Polaribacter aestuariivivens TaxID=2304626 RepID=A0A5S3N5V0_9FLAO|nr:hypothetical protein [Polaribacter aestuariivivens]TMM29844.1 hypothetical protein FDT66_08195 [Polaribacter aestuariivivens]
MDLINALIEEKNSLFERIKAIDVLLKSFNVEIKKSTNHNQTEIVSDKKDKEIIKGLTDANRFLFVLKKHQRFMKVREIAEYLSKETGENIDNWIPKMSRKTRVLKNANKIVKYQVGTKNTNVFWGSPNWIDKNNEILKEYIYSNSNINNSKSDNLFDL